MRQLILDDFGLRKLSPQESGHFYDVLVERDRHAATIITSNRTVDEWVALFETARWCVALRRGCVCRAKVAGL